MARSHSQIVTPVDGSHFADFAGLLVFGPALAPRPPPGRPRRPHTFSQRAPRAAVASVRTDEREGP